MGSIFVLFFPKTYIVPPMKARSLGFSSLTSNGIPASHGLKSGCLSHKESRAIASLACDNHAKTPLYDKIIFSNIFQISACYYIFLMTITLGTEVKLENPQQVHNVRSVLFCLESCSCLQASHIPLCWLSRFEINNDSAVIIKEDHLKLSDFSSTILHDRSEFRIVCVKFERLKQSGWSDDHLRTMPKWIWI